MKISFVSADPANPVCAPENFVGDNESVAPQNAQVIVAVGGDGTMLEALHTAHHLEKPFYGINCGSVGFLLNPASDDKLEDRINNAVQVQVYPLHMVATDAEGKKHEAIAFNEVSLLRETRQAANLKIGVANEVRIDELVCDGVMLSTPVGSTAYNLSANGPILPLSANVMALTPISAFRPRRWSGALLPDHLSVEIEVMNPKKRPVSVTADSTEFRDIRHVSIKQAKDKSVTLLFDPEHNLEDRILKEQFIQ